jgi:hypothetical protein
MPTKNRDADPLPVFSELYNALGRLGPLCSKLYGTGRHRDLVNIAINPKGYSDAGDFFSDYCAQSLLKKFPGLNTGIDTASVAIRKFFESEDRCHKTNIRLYHSMHIDSDMYNLIDEARHIASGILGDFTWDMTLPFLSHGPGATVGVLKRDGHPVKKFGHLKPTVTGECATIDACFTKYACLLEKSRRDNGVDLKVVAGSRIATVPKDARSDRVIAIEPLLNMFYQKGIGGLMRSRLRYAGCDLNDQTINQSLARLGSVNNRLATIDLASASDSVSCALVEMILPDDWLLAMKSVRSNFTSVPGEVGYHCLHKFSSMGNGFTFELESLIFLVLGRALIRRMGGKGREISVYGDDIVIPAGYVDRYLSVLKFAGFEPNSEKTFSDGPFRESCGKHYFLGRDVTPLYIKGDVVGPERTLWFANSVRRLAHRFLGMGWGCDDRFRGVYTSIVDSLPQDLARLSIPDGYGDGALVRDFDEVSPQPRACSGYVEGYVTKHVRRVYKERPFSEWPALVYKLHSLEKRDGAPAIGSRGDRGVPTPRYSLKAVKLEVRRWDSLGPWVSATSA